MRESKTRQWFLRGFFLTLLLLAGAFSVRAALTQNGGNVDEATAPVDAGRPWRTDDPLGRPFVALDEPGEPLSNLEAQAAESADGGNVSDDPHSRGLIAAPAAQGALSNLETQALEASSLVVLSPEEASRVEEAREIDAAYTSPLIIPAADFTADGYNPDSQFFSFGGGYWSGDSEAYGCMIAPAYLPNGVTVTDMFATVYDNDGSLNVSLSLRRLDNFSGIGVAMATAASAGAIGLQTISDTSVDNALVVYPDYSYYITVCLQSGSLRLYSVRLYYEET